MKEFEKNNAVSVLVNLLSDLSKLDISKPDYIKDVMSVISKYFQADFCIWHHTKRKRDFLDFKDYDLSNLKRMRVVSLKSQNSDEALLIVNPKIDDELEQFLLDEIKAVLENVSKSDFFVADLKTVMFTDALTGLNNYESFQSNVLTRDKFEKVCVCFVDVNGLGNVNNLYGHEAGDRMLMAVASAMRKVFRAGDIYRKSGDEFIVVSEGISEEEFRKRINHAKDILSQNDYSISCGIIYRDTARNIEELVNLADTLMYIEKEQFRRENPSKYLVMKNKENV